MSDALPNLKKLVNFKSNIVEVLNQFSHLVKNMVSSDQELEVWSSCSSSSPPSSASMPSVDPVNYWQNLLQNTFTRFRNRLNDCGIKNLYFMFDLDRFERDLLQLLDTSRSYSACGLEINGFTSFVDNVTDFFNYVIKLDYLKDHETLHHIKLVLDLFRPIAKLLIRGHQERLGNDTAFDELKSNNNRPCLVRKDFQELESMIKIREDHEANLDILLTKFFAFYIDETTKPWFHIVIRLLVFSVLPFPACFKMFNEQFVHSSFRNLCKTASSETPLKALSFYDSFLAKQVFSLITYNPKTIVRTVWIHGQERWTIAKDHLGVIDNRDNPKSKYQLRCRLITHSSIANEHGVVVFFCHGGGMILFGPECHELYTKRFVENLGGAALFCPDYTLKAIYPVAFQEILDSYLWLTSGHSSVSKKLGFQPRKIIIAGDSAGGVLGLGLLNILHQIEIIDSNLELVFPSDLLFFYGAFLLNSLSSPSRTTTLFEPVLSEGILLIIGGCIGGIEGGCDRKLVSDSRVVSFVTNLKEELSLFKHFFSSRITTPWYLTDTGLDVPAINKLLTNLSSTLFYSLNNFNFQRFAYTRLYLFTTVKCIFLDDNVDLARAWQGPVELHIARKLSHGFLMVPGEQRAFQYSVDLLKKAIGRALQD